MINLNDDSILSIEQKKQKNKFLNDLQKEINDIDYKINHIDNINRKNALKKEFKKFLFYLKISLPYLYTGIFTFSIFSLFGKTPFILDNQKQFLERKTQIDNDGNKEITEQFEKYNYSYKLTIFYYSKWKLQESGSYIREEKVYNLNLYDEKIINNILNNNLENLSMDVFNNPDYSNVTSKMHLTDDELDKNDYIKAIFYDEDKNTFILSKESDVTNFNSTILWIFITLLLEYIPMSIDKKILNDEKDYYIREIENKYPYVKRDELVKILEIKKDNIDCLVKNNGK